MNDTLHSLRSGNLVMYSRALGIVGLLYLAWSFITGNWKFTRIVWPVAGVLFAPFIALVKHLCGKE